MACSREPGVNTHGDFSNTPTFNNPLITISNKMINNHNKKKVNFYQLRNGPLCHGYELFTNSAKSECISNSAVYQGRFKTSN